MVIDDMVSVLVTEFYKIEKEISSDFYNMYILKKIIESCVENRPFVVSENPDIKNTEIVTELAKRWNNVKTTGGDGHKKYEDLAKNDKDRYEQEKTVWENNKPQEIPEPVVVAAEKPKKKAASKKTKTPAVSAPEPETVVVEEEVLEEVLEEEVEQPKVEEKPKKVGKGKKTKA